jgi:hypothetical protein
MDGVQNETAMSLRSILLDAHTSKSPGDRTMGNNPEYG